MRLHLSALLTLLMTTSFQALAGLPANSSVTGANTGSGNSMLVYLIKTYGQIGVIAVALFIVVGVLWYMWSAFMQSNKKQEWGGFIVTGIAGLALIAATVGLAIFANSLISDMTTT